VKLKVSRLETALSFGNSGVKNNAGSS